ncbi:hypothetical protein Tco_1579097, partial [Tanacetum coccineum]
MKNIRSKDEVRVLQIRTNPHPLNAFERIMEPPKQPYQLSLSVLDLRGVKRIIEAGLEEVNDFISQIIAKEHFDSQPLKGLRAGVISENIGDEVDQEVGVISKTRRDRGSDSAHVNHLRAP